MKRLGAILLVGVLLAWILPQAQTVRADGSSKLIDTRPNIVLITMDDMRTDEMKYMTHVRQLIAERGFRFDRAYSTLPQCCPARTSLMTGMYAHNHGVMSNYYRFGGGYQQFQKSVDIEQTVGVLLQQSGYETTYIGKFLNGYAKTGVGEKPPGWDNWRGLVGKSVYHYDRQTYNVDGQNVVTGKHNTRSVTQLALEQLDPIDNPYFVWMNYVAPHSGQFHDRTGEPHPLKRDRSVPVTSRHVVEERNLHDKPSFVRKNGELSPLDRKVIARNHRARVRSLIGVDREIGRIVRHLDTTGQLSNTVLIFHSDNGYLMGEHGFRTGKNVPYETSTRVPLTMAGPNVPVGRSEVPVTLQDVSATLMAVAEVVPQDPIDGVSLFRIISEERVFMNRPVLYESGPTFNNKSNGLRSSRGQRFFTAISYRQWVFIRYFDGQQELYNLRRDPQQLRSLHASPRHRKVRRELLEELEQLQDCLGDECNRLFALSGRRS